MGKQAFNKYKTASHNVSKSKQVLMLYEGAIRFLKKAKDAAIANNIQEKFNNLDKFCQIINGLSSALDHAKAGELSETLRKFYLSIYLRATSLHRENKLEIYDNILAEMKEMLQSWQEVDNEFTKKNFQNPTES